MNRPFVSIVIETITREDYADRPLADDLQPALDGVARQTYPRELIETILVIDEGLAGPESDEIVRRYPSVTIVKSLRRNYFAAKNAGAQAARGSLLALLDGDCEPVEEWLEALVARCQPDVSIVAGRTRYIGASLGARTFSVSDFANVTGDASGAASGFNLNNVLFRREVLLAHPLDARIRRNGGCYLLYHQLRAAGARIVYEPRAAVAHGLDIAGSGFVKKHFERGFDSVSVYQFDEGAVLRGTPLFRRFGAVAVVAFAGRRILLDWVRIIRKRDQVGIPLITFPYFAMVSVAVRLIELAGALTGLDPRRRIGLSMTASPRQEI
jgi:glycosyltransferase involved in cell wall biosynthesis